MPVWEMVRNASVCTRLNLIAKAAILARTRVLVVEGHADEALLDTYEKERIPLGDRNALLFIRVEQGLIRMTLDYEHARPRQDCRLCDEVQARADAGVPHHLPNRHCLPGKPAVENVAGPAWRRAARGRSFSVVAAQVPGERPGRRPVPEARRHALQPDRHRAACAP